jgi:hypothetical protein
MERIYDSDEEWLGSEAESEAQEKAKQPAKRRSVLRNELARGEASEASPVYARREHARLPKDPKVIREMLATLKKKIKLQVVDKKVSLKVVHTAADECGGEPKEFWAQKKGC